MDIKQAVVAEEEFWKEVKQNEEIIENDKSEVEKNLKQVIELSQHEIVNKKLGSEFLTTGVVVDHNLEDSNILGGYVQIKLDLNKRDAFVIYNPYENGKQIDCMNKINTDLVVGDNVEVRGVIIKELNSVEPVEMFISTCESSEYYIKKI